MHHILWLTENYYPSQNGAAQSCDRITSHLKQRGVHIDLVHFSHKHCSWYSESKTNGRIFCCPLDDNPTHAINQFWALLQHDAQRHHITHVLAFGGLLPLLAAPVYAAWLQKPLLTVLQGGDFEQLIFDDSRRFTLQDALQRSAMVTSTSPETRKKIQQFFPRTKSRCVANGIDMETWRLTANDQKIATAWRTDNVAVDRRILGFFGNLAPKKGVEFFLECLAKSGQSHRFHLLFIGDISPIIQKWLVNHQGKLQYTLLPFLDRYDLIPYYSVCDFVVIPSFYDGMPNTLLEACALGTAILCSRTDGMTDLLAQGKDCYNFIPGNVADCISTIHKVANDTDANIQKLTTNARQKILKNFNSAIESKQYLQILDQCMLKKPKESLLVGFPAN